MATLLDILYFCDKILLRNETALHTGGRAMKKLRKGEVVEEDGNLLTVLVSVLPSDESEHVYIMRHNKQIGDFQFGQPDKDCDICFAAQEVASGIYNVYHLPVLVTTE